MSTRAQVLYKRTIVLARTSGEDQQKGPKCLAAAMLRPTASKKALIWNPCPALHLPHFSLRQTAPKASRQKQAFVLTVTMGIGNWEANQPTNRLATVATRSMARKIGTCQLSRCTHHTTVCPAPCRPLTYGRGGGIDSLPTRPVVVRSRNNLNLKYSIVKCGAHSLAISLARAQE